MTQKEISKRGRITIILIIVFNIVNQFCTTSVYSAFYVPQAITHLFSIFSVCSYFYLITIYFKTYQLFTSENLKFSSIWYLSPIMRIIPFGLTLLDGTLNFNYNIIGIGFSVLIYVYIFIETGIAYYYKNIIKNTMLSKHHFYPRIVAGILYLFFNNILNLSTAAVVIINLAMLYTVVSEFIMFYLLDDLKIETNQENKFIDLVD